MTYRSLVLCVLLPALAATCDPLGCEGAEPSVAPTKAADASVTRVGIYDSRAIAAAYWTPERLVSYSRSLEERQEMAVAVGKVQEAKETYAKLWAHRNLLRKQGFSTAPVDDILEHIKDRLPKIARKVLSRFMPLATKPSEERVTELLSERELEVLKLAAKGMSNKDIAEQLFLSVRTVQSHLANIFTKLDVGSRTEAILCGLRRGWFTLEDLP